MCAHNDGLRYIKKCLECYLSVGETQQVINNSVDVQVRHNHHRNHSVIVLYILVHLWRQCTLFQCVK